MKLLLLFIFGLLGVVWTKSIESPEGRIDLIRDHYENLSAPAKAKIVEAVLQARRFLCTGDDVNEEINEIFCTGKMSAERIRGMIGARKRSCFDCDVADPICMNSCPQR